MNGKEERKMSEVTREKFIKAWSDHVLELAAIPLQVKDPAQFARSFMAYNEVKDAAAKLIRDAADAVYGQAVQS